MIREQFINEGYTVLETQDKENKLLQFLKENYPQTILDGEIKWDELKSALGLPIDEKLNGYGLNFIGRNVASAKYKQQTDKALTINNRFSVNFDNTQNMVLKGDNLDCLKILKSKYNGAIKCIYIDPPYNTVSDEFVYPDRFDKEEAEVLGLANISDADYDRMQFSFRTKKSHNGWLSFMYPRLMLARDLLSKDGVIFISIDDNEQANLKLLCDEVFGEENFVECLKWKRKKQPSFLATHTAKLMEYILVYAKNSTLLKKLSVENISDSTKKVINLTNQVSERLFSKGVSVKLGEKGIIEKGVYKIKTMTVEYLDDVVYDNYKTISDVRVRAQFSVSQEKINEYISDELLFITINNGLRRNVSEEERQKRKSITDLLLDWGDNQDSENEMKELFGEHKPFDYTKPIKLIYNIVKSMDFSSTDIILDFFAGSGTTGHAVMKLNAEDGGNRKFILCQIDEPIAKDKPAYQFCIDNNLPPVISSITIERLKRAGEKIKNSLNRGASNSFQPADIPVGLVAEPNPNYSAEQVSDSLDIGFKVFDLADAPKLDIAEDGQISIQNTYTDPLSRIYNMIFSVGVDNPTLFPECIVDNCLYRMGKNYYITNAEILDRAENKQHLTDAIKNGNVYIDGWTASINTTLQQYKEDVKILF